MLYIINSLDRSVGRATGFQPQGRGFKPLQGQKFSLTYAKKVSLTIIVLQDSPF